VYGYKHFLLLISRRVLNAFSFFSFAQNKRRVEKPMSEDEMLAELTRMFDDNIVSNIYELVPFLEYWMLMLDRSQACDKDLEMNEMHVVGAVLSVVLYRSTFEPDTLQEMLKDMHTQITITDKNLCDYGWEDLCNLCLSLQLEFSRLYVRTGGGYDSNVDVERLCLCLMYRAGFWFSHRFRKIAQDDEVDARQSEDIPSEALRGLVDVDTDGYCTVRVDSMRHFLNAIHSMLGLNLMLHNTEEMACEDDLPELSSHHVEASAEYFFTLSMTSDCKVGTITQYAHKFAHLFHSISQVIYFNVPTYARQKQLKITDLQKPNAPHINVLPALLELYPTVPILFEHTGAGLTTTHSKHKFAWVVWDNFVFLVTNSGRVLISDDLRTLTTLFEKKSGDA
jgi:hypothetical protein